jgi:hypothetical protein
LREFLKIFRDTGHNFTANKIHKLNETGNSTSHVSPKIICAKEIKQVGSVGNVTMIVDIKVFGSHVRAVLIFPKVHLKNNMLAGASTFSVGGANPTGWSN